MSLDSLQSAESVQVKDEPSWDVEWASVASVDQHIEYDPESAQAGLVDHAVKTEGCESEGACDGEAASRDLYKDHEVKEELVQGPEVFQRPRVTLVCRGTKAVTLELVSLRSAETPSLRSHGLSVGEGGCLAHTDQGPRTVSSKTCSVRLERMHVDMEQRTCRVGDNSYKFQSYLPTHDDCYTIDKNLTKDKLNSLTQNNNETKKPDSISLRNKKQVIHQETHVGEKPYKCAHCNFISLYESTLKRHEMKHTCEEKKHTGKKLYTCSYCSYTCTKKDHMKYHERTHTGEKPYKCSYCSYTCSRKVHMKDHERTHTGDKPYKCAYCIYTCTRKNNLKVHERIHTGEKPYKCFSCSYTCRKKTNMKDHERIHTGDKPHKCSYCSFTCSQKGNMKNHERTHTGDNPYKCSYCSYTCSQKVHMKDHERTHTGEKPYKCDYCIYTCTRKNNLKVHERIHTREKPYKCSSCSYTCSQKGSLITHEKIHTRDKPYKTSVPTVVTLASEKVE